MSVDRPIKRKSLASDIPCRVFDESAETIKELMAATGYGCSSMKIYADAQIVAGHWERVWKRGSNRPVPAYRRAK